MNRWKERRQEIVNRFEFEETAKIHSILGKYPSRNEFSVHCYWLQMSHISLSFQLLFLSGRIVQFVPVQSLRDRRPIFVLLSLFLVCLPVFLLFLSAEYHNVLMCFSLYDPHNTTF